MTKTSISKHGTPRGVCSIEGCTYVHKGLSFCEKHYRRFKNHGDPLDAGTTRPSAPFPVFVERFWGYVDKTDINGCWNWTGRKDKDGYGAIKYRRRSWRVHRMSYFLHTNIEPTLYILHSCDNPACVNPAHLREGTAQDNARDREERNRGYRGPRWWSRKKVKG